MGCDIHSFVEVKNGGRWDTGFAEFPLTGFDLEYAQEHGDLEYTESPFDWRSYGMFGFLADVRNYSYVPCIQEPSGIPSDVSETVGEAYGDMAGDAHTASSLTLRQLTEYDYEQMFWDRRVTKQTGPNSWSGAALAEEGEGEMVKLRDFLGEEFFHQIEIMKTLGSLDDVRVVFWFDN